MSHIPKVFANKYPSVKIDALKEVQNSKKFTKQSFAKTATNHTSHVKRTVGSP
jgi:hypothetical protein